MGHRTIGSRYLSHQITRQLQQQYPGLPLVPYSLPSLPRADWVLLLAYRYVAQAGRWRICGALLDLNGGYLLSAHQIDLADDAFDATPTAFFRDTPVYLAWQESVAAGSVCDASSFRHIRSTRVAEGLEVDSIMELAMTQYNAGDFRAALKSFAMLKEQSHWSPKDRKVRLLYRDLGQYMAHHRLRRPVSARSLQHFVVGYLMDWYGSVDLNLHLTAHANRQGRNRQESRAKLSWLKAVGTEANLTGACMEIRSNVLGTVRIEFDQGRSTERMPPARQAHAQWVLDHLRKWFPAARNRFYLSSLAAGPISRHGPVTNDIRDERRRSVVLTKTVCGARPKT